MFLDELGKCYKCVHFSKWSYKFNAIMIQIQEDFVGIFLDFCGELILKFM